MILRRAFPFICLAVAACVSAPKPIPPTQDAPAPMAQATSAVPKEAAPAQPKKDEIASLTVTVKGVEPGPSRLLVGLFDEARYKTKPPPFTRDGPAHAPETTVVFEGLKPGRYAVRTMQDLNGNNDMDKTLVGIPEEPFGLSNDVKPVMSEPGFKDTSFEVKPGPNAITIHLQRM